MKKDFSIGFIGGGAMGEALIAGILGHFDIEQGNVYVSDLFKADYLKEKYGINATSGEVDFGDKIDLLFLAVKPKDIDAVMSSVAAKIKDETVVVSIVAGLRLENIEKHFDRQPVVRVMPNTCMMVGQSMSAYAYGSKANEGNAGVVAELLAGVGKVVNVPENLLDAVTGLSGSAPAYAFLMIDALSDGGVAAGLPRQTATLLAAQTMLGAAKMVLETGRHPDELRDQVTSPAGTTIAGIRVLEERGVRAALINAVISATERSAELGKK